MLDLKAAVEKLILPEGELEGVLVLAVARSPKGKVNNRVYTEPQVQHERLLRLIRDYLVGPRR